jgi:hypothetical protein
MLARLTGGREGDSVSDGVLGDERVTRGLDRPASFSGNSIESEGGGRRSERAVEWRSSDEFSRDMRAGNGGAKVEEKVEVRDRTRPPLPERLGVGVG